MGSDERDGDPVGVGANTALTRVVRFDPNLIEGITRVLEER